MKPNQPEKLSRTELAALRRLREQVRQQKRERSKPVTQPVEKAKEERSNV